MKFNLSAGNRHDVPEGRKLIKSIDSKVARYLLMDRAYNDDDKTRALVFKQGLMLKLRQRNIEYQVYHSE